MVKPSLKKEKDRNISINAVLPTEQVTAQAKSELEREDINPKVYDLPLTYVYRY